MRLAQIFEGMCGRMSAALVCLALVGVPARAQTPAAPASAHPAAAATSNDPKRAEKDVDAGDKAAAEGRFDDALKAYDEAARYAPQNFDVLAKGATLRMQLVRAHTDNAEQFALNGDVIKAIDEFHTAMRIDPGNPELAERAAQVAAMRHDNNAAPSRSTIQGLPKAQCADGQAQPRSARRHAQRLRHGDEVVLASRRRSIPTCRRAVCICA